MFRPIGIIEQPSLPTFPNPPLKAIKFITYIKYVIYILFAICGTNITINTTQLLCKFWQIIESKILGILSGTLERNERLTTLKTRRDISCQRQLSTVDPACFVFIPVLSYR